jgi:phosphatidylserine synthase
MSRVKSNIIISLLLATATIIFYLFAKDFPGSAKNFPITVLLIIFILSIGQIIVSLYRFKNLSQKDFDIPKKPLIVFILSFICVALMEYIGFFASFILLLVSLFYLLKVENKKLYIVGTIILFTFIFVVFEFGLKVSLLKIGF